MKQVWSFWNLCTVIVSTSERQHSCSSFSHWSLSTVCRTENVLWKNSLLPRERISKHTRLCNVCGRATFERSTVRSWMKRVTDSERGQAQLQRFASSGRPVTTVSPEMLQRDDAIVHEDRRVTIRQLALSISVNKGRVSHISRDLGY